MTKPYNTKSLQDRLGQLSREEGGKGSAGLYRHPESGNEAITMSDPLFGEAQSNAFEQLGFVRIRDARPDEINNVFDQSIAAGNVETDSLKGLSARMAQLEGVAAENKRLTEENARLRAAAGENSTSESQKDSSGDQIDTSKSGSEKSLEEQDASELRETVDREGVNSEGLNTVQEFRDAIQAARENKKESEKA